MDDPTYEEATPRETAAPYSPTIIAGETVPFTDDECRATYSGVWIAEYKVAAMLHDAADGDYWRDRAHIERDNRTADRAYCDSLLADERATSAYYKRESAAYRIAVPVAALIGVIAGVAVGLAADDLGEVVP